MPLLAFRKGGIVLFATDGGGFAIRATLRVRTVRDHCSCSELEGCAAAESVASDDRAAAAFPKIRRS